MKKIIFSVLILSLLVACSEPKKVVVAPVATPEQVVAPVATAVAEPVKPALMGTHTVVPKDTLWFISGKWYKDPVLWPAIYQINKDQIKDPDLIYPGQQFGIPVLKADGKLSDSDNTLLQQGYLEAYRVYKEKGRADAEDYKTESGNYVKK